jgi:hypothetical protein
MDGLNINTRETEERKAKENHVSSNVWESADRDRRAASFIRCHVNVPSADSFTTYLNDRQEDTSSSMEVWKA